MIFIAIIDICNLTFAYPGSYDNIFEDVSFRIDTSWKLGFVGRNGRGKTTFLKLLMGNYEYSGKILSSVGFEYFPFSIEDSNLSTLDYNIMELKKQYHTITLSSNFCKFKIYLKIALVEIITPLIQINNLLVNTSTHKI